MAETSKIITDRSRLSLEMRVLHVKKTKIVMTNGVFDLLHIGHVRLLQAARALGDRLLVAVNTDESVKKIKGPNRPIIPLAERMEVLSALACVDYVTSFDEPDPLAIITLVQPHLLVKGGDWGEDAIIGRNVVEARGGKVVRIPLAQGKSTTQIIEKLKGG